MNHPHDQDAVLGGQSPGASRDAAVLGGTKGRDQAYRNHYNFSEKLPNGLELAMIAIPSGTFLMGSPETELESSDQAVPRHPATPASLSTDRMIVNKHSPSALEVPQHPVTVPSFFLGQYPITQAQWRAVTLLPQVSQELNPDPSKMKGDNRPVERVSWNHASEFCARLSQYTGREYRLPTEAEWEYACRAGTTTPFHFGETISSDLANYNGEVAYGDGPEGIYRRETTPVDYFDIANAFGLYDMHGNICEWCLDQWHENYEGAPTDGSAWLDDHENSFHVKRGGAWRLIPEYCRSAFRYRFSSDVTSHDVGFRVVCVSPRTL